MAMKFLCIYGTTEGQTRKITERIAAQIRENGFEVALLDSAALPPDLDVGAFDAVVLAASVHQQRYQTAFAHFVKKHRLELQARPSAFVSVSLSSVLEENEDDAQEMADRFLDETGWRPTRTELVAGALAYTQYDFFKRQLMKWIVDRAGGPTDASQDYEFTDWDALDTFAVSFLETAGQADKA